MSARAQPAELAAVVAYAKNLGLAFQIVDDLIDVRAATSRRARTSGQDAKKTTFVSFSGVEGARALARRAHRRQPGRARSRSGPRRSRSRELARYVVDAQEVIRHDALPRVRGGPGARRLRARRRRDDQLPRVLDGAPGHELSTRSRWRSSRATTRAARPTRVRERARPPPSRRRRSRRSAAAAPCRACCRRARRRSAASARAPKRFAVLSPATSSPTPALSRNATSERLSRILRRLSASSSSIASRRIWSPEAGGEPALEVEDHDVLRPAGLRRACAASRSLVDVTTARRARACTPRRCA